jgi:hypothetical protein
VCDHVRAAQAESGDAKRLHQVEDFNFLFDRRIAPGDCRPSRRGFIIPQDRAGWAQ